MSYYTEPGFVFVQEAGNPPSEETIKEQLRDPNTLKEFFKSTGIPDTENITLDQLKKIFRKLGREADYESMLPMLEALAGGRGTINTDELQKTLLTAINSDVFSSLSYLARTTHAFSGIS